MSASRLQIQTLAWLAVVAWTWSNVVGGAEPKAPEAPIQNGVTVVLHLVNEPQELILPADVISVQPNGVLVLQAHDWSIDRSGAYEYTLTGKVSGKNVTPDGFVTSEQIADLSFSKRYPAEPHAATATSWLFDLFSWTRSH